MPIYEYRCTSCGFQKEFLRKMSDPALSDCPACGKSTLGKLVTAAGFQLKGTGWYVTDFKGGSKPKDAGESNQDKGEDKSAGADAKPATAESKSGQSQKSEGSKSGESSKSEGSKSGQAPKSSDTAAAST